MADSTTGLLINGKESPSYSPPNENSDALFSEEGKSPKEKLVMYMFVSFVVIMVLITVILSLYRGATVDATYILLGVSIICIALVEIVLVYWCKRGELPEEKTWFLYFVGICISLEAVLTNVLLYHRPKN